MGAGDGDRDALDAGQARADEVEGVGAVGLGAGRADAGAAVAAGQVEHAVGHVLGARGRDDSAGGRLDGVQRPVQPDRVSRCSTPLGFPSAGPSVLASAADLLTRVATAKAAGPASAAAFAAEVGTMRVLD